MTLEEEFQLELARDDTDLFAKWLDGIALMAAALGTNVSKQISAINRASPKTRHRVSSCLQTVQGVARVQTRYRANVLAQ